MKLLIQNSSISLGITLSALLLLVSAHRPLQPLKVTRADFLVTLRADWTRRLMDPIKN